MDASTVLSWVQDIIINRPLFVLVFALLSHYVWKKPLHSEMHGHGPGHGGGGHGDEHVEASHSDPVRSMEERTSPQVDAAST